MELKELETKIQKIFNNNNLKSGINFKDDVVIYFYHLPDDIDILSFSLDNENNIKVKEYHLGFYACDSIEYLNKVKQAIEVSILWKNDFIQKQVIELIREYSIQFDNIDTGRLINGAELCQD